MTSTLLLDLPDALLKRSQYYGSLRLKLSSISGVTFASRLGLETSMIFLGQEMIPKIRSHQRKCLQVKSFMLAEAVRNLPLVSSAKIAFQFPSLKWNRVTRVEPIKCLGTCSPTTDLGGCVQPHARGW